MYLLCVLLHHHGFYLSFLSHLLIAFMKSSHVELVLI